MTTDIAARTAKTSKKPALRLPANAGMRNVLERLIDQTEQLKYTHA
jgi:hypothetical protein